MTITNLLMHVIFYVFAISAISSALVVVSSRHPVKAILFLVLTFVASAGMWVMLHAEFLALILVVVYVGAVMTLFLFVVMMLNLEPGQLRGQLVRYYPVGILLVLLLMAILAVLVGPAYFGDQNVSVVGAQTGHPSNVYKLGHTLYTQFLYPFELAGVILLVAMVAAITLSFSGHGKRKQKQPAEQIKVDSSRRIRLMRDLDNEQ